MEPIWLRFKDEDGCTFLRNALDVLYAEALGKQCVLHFENGERLVWNQIMGAFHKLVWDSNLFRRLDRELLVKVFNIRHASGRALLATGKVLRLGREANSRLRNYILRHPY